MNNLSSLRTKCRIKIFKQEKKKRQANLKGTRWYYCFEVETQQHLFRNSLKQYLKTYLYFENN